MIDEFKKKATNYCIRVFGHSLRSAISCTAQEKWLTEKLQRVIVRGRSISRRGVSRSAGRGRGGGRGLRGLRASQNEMEVGTGRALSAVILVTLTAEPGGNRESARRGSKNSSVRGCE